MAFTEIGANTLDTGYDIENSCRFNTGDSPALSYSISSTASSWTVSFWLKSSNKHNDNTMYPFSFGNASNDDATGISFSSGGLAYYNEASATATLVRDTSVLLRDPSAWYHVVCKNDGGTITTYLNGVQQASGSGGTSALDGTVVYIGRFASTSPMYLDAYISEFYFIDGTAYSASTFGETNDNGVWIPIKASPTFGSDGFFCEFKQTGTSANSSGIGADTSGNDNHLTVTNLAATDVTTDTPTNNFATLNPLSDLNATLSEGNTQLVRNASSAVAAVATMAPANGKWYYEFQLSANNNAAAGVVDVDKWDSTTDVYDYDDSGAVAVLIESSDNFIVDYTEDTAGGTRLQNSVDLNTAKYGFAVDLDNQGFYASANGNWYTGSAFDDTDFSNATNLANDIPAGTSMAFFARGSIASASYANFGNPGGADSISSGNSDANGYGNFEYAVPSGYYALCTKNLAEYG